MCRNQLVRAERCKCSYGARRSASDRAYYAATKAAGATRTPHPVFTNVDTAPAPPTVPDVNSIKALADDVNATYITVNGENGYDLVQASRANIDSNYASRDLAVIAVGEQIAARSEMHAGITAQEARDSYLIRETAARLEVDRINAITTPVHREYLAAVQKYDWTPRDSADRYPAYEALQAAAKGYNKLYDDTGAAAASAHLNLVLNARDEETLADLAKLSSGYSQALAEVRETGGQMDWNPKSTKAAKATFDEAISVYPTEWIAKSNERNAPLARISKARAHYADVTVKTTSKRSQVAYTTEYPEGQEPGDTPNSTYVKSADQSSAGFGATQYDVLRWTVANRWDSPDDGSAPSGTGWEKYSDGYTDMWRKPNIALRRVSSEVTPEITTNNAGYALPGRTGTFAISVHELSHRMEASVPGITRMEEDFLVRRTSTGGERDPLVSLYKGKKEYARPDDFVNAYMGKTYSSGSREVLSCGTQGLFGGDFGGFIGVGRNQPDTEYRAFILGVLGSAGRPHVNQG